MCKIEVRAAAVVAEAGALRIHLRMREASVEATPAAAVVEAEVATAVGIAKTLR